MSWELGVLVVVVAFALSGMWRFGYDAGYQAGRMDAVKYIKNLVAGKEQE